MPHTFTRQELFDLVWSEPIQTVAKRLRISNVTLAKACRRADLLVPPPGHWTKRAAGKKVAKPALPLRGPGMSDRIVLGRDRWAWGPDPITLDTPDPPEPVFSQTVEEMADGIRRRIGAVRRTRDLAQARPRILKLLADDEQRRKRKRESPYMGILDPPLFETPFEQRRLRVISSLMRGLDKVGVTVWIDAKDGRSLVANVGDHRVSFAIDSAGTVRKENPLPQAAHPMRCRLMALHSETEAVETWSDHPGQRLEQRLQEIAVAIVVHGERVCRSSAEHYRAWVISKKAELAEEQRTREKEQRRLERERFARLETARVNRLLNQARAMRHAEEIRAYAAAVRARQQTMANPLATDELEDWTAWVLDQADRIDPVLNGLFRTIRANESERGC
jgi:hypothetical protein